MMVARLEVADTDLEAMWQQALVRWGAEHSKRMPRGETDRMMERNQLAGSTTVTTQTRTRIAQHSTRVQHSSQAEDHRYANP